MIVVARPVGFGHGPGAQLADEHVGPRSFDQREDAVAALPGAFSHHRVELPMPDCEKIAFSLAKPWTVGARTGVGEWRGYGPGINRIPRCSPNRGSRHFAPDCLAHD